MAASTIRGVFSILILALLIALTSSPLAAQAAAAEAQEEEQDDEALEPEEGFLDTITVTAQKREQDQREVPLSLTILGPAEIEVITTVKPSGPEFTPRPTGKSIAPSTTPSREVATRLLTASGLTGSKETSLWFLLGPGTNMQMRVSRSQSCSPSRTPLS